MGVGKTNKNEVIIKLFVNTNYIDDIIDFCNRNEEKVVNHFTEILKHEVHHLVFGHLTLDLPDKQRLTIACELSDNSFIDRKKLVSETGEKPGIFPEDFGFKSKLSVHDYYNLLNDNKKFNEMRKDMSSSIELIISDESDNDGNGNNSDDGTNSNGNNKVKVTIDEHGKWSIIEGDDMTKEMIKDIVRQANETCKQMNKWGDIPGELKEAISDNYATDKAVIPWEVVLKDFLASSSENVLDYTMKRRSKRFNTRPGTKKDDVLNVAIGIDTSGSVDVNMLKLFFQELYWIEKTGTKMTIFEWDTQVNNEYDFRDFTGDVTGRGGTDPTDFLEKVSERKFDCVITFTDMYFADIKVKYNMPMLWVVDRGGFAYGDKDNFPCEEGIIMLVNDSRDGFEVIRK
jgi:predicted metal-dependent peptidase